jgi:DNA-binding transcriptional LysR family regulator
VTRSNRPPTPVLPDIAIRQLEYLVAVADAPTWARAAETVGVSPSALSQGLAELERRLGVGLFEPVGRRRVVRDTATPVLDHARQVVALTRDVVEWADRLRTARSGTVRLGMIDVAATVHHPEVVRAFRAERPDVDLVLMVAPSGALLDALRAGTIELAVCVEPPSPVAGVTTQPLLDEPLAVIAPPSTRIAAPTSWGPWVMFPASSHTRQRVDAALRSLGAPLSIAAESHQPDVLLQMVHMGLGWSVLPAASLDASRVSVGRTLLDRRIVLARRDGSIHDPAADELARRITL